MTGRAAIEKQLWIAARNISKILKRNEGFFSYGVSLAWSTGRLCGWKKEAHKTLAQNPQNSTWLCRKDSSQGALRRRNRQSVIHRFDPALYFAATVKRYYLILLFSCSPPCKLGWAGAGGRRSTPFIFALGMSERAKKNCILEIRTLCRIQT